MLLKRLALILTTVLLITVCSLCIAEETTTISFESEEYSVPVGKSITLKAIITPKGNLKLEWSSSDENVATVAKNGAVKGVSVGETIITVKAVDNPGISASCVMKVVNPVKKITLFDKTVSMAVGTTWRLKATVDPEDATNKNLVWSSSNEKVAMVSSDGVISGMSKGSAKITVSTVDGSNAKTTINVKVDEYHLVFTTPFTQSAEYWYSFWGYISIRGGVKKGNVSISNVDRDISGSSNHSDDYFNVTPLKAGTDTVTLKMEGGKKLNFEIFVHPDAFKMQDLGCGYGAIVTPGEFGLFEGHSYQIIRDKCTWTEAKKKCEDAGGHLVTITSPEEQKYIELLNYDNKTLWIGLRKGNADVWKWVTKEEFSYTNWANGEPNDYGTREYPYENVGAIRPEWNDYHENNTADIYGYICEWDEYTTEVEAVEVEGTVIEPDSLGVHNEHTYQIIEGKFTWKEAKAKCEEMGGHLATITSPDEQRFLKRLNKSSKTLWIGLRRGNDDTWNWVTGEPLVITVWNEGEPNNYWTKEFTYENVVAMNPTWNDIHEKNTADIGGFICEWDEITVDQERINDAANKMETPIIPETEKKPFYVPDDPDDPDEMLGPDEPDGPMDLDEPSEPDGFDEPMPVDDIESSDKPSDAEQFNGHSYKVYKESVSWNKAKEKCESLGGHLATITSQEEQTFLEKLIKDKGEFWIGLCRIDDDNFAWITGEALGYANWGNGEPNNYWLEAFPGENSVAIRPDWNDYHENNLEHITGYICEWDN